MGRDLKVLKEKWKLLKRAEPLRVGLLFEKSLYREFQKHCAPVPVNRVFEDWMREELEQGKKK